MSDRNNNGSATNKIKISEDEIINSAKTINNIQVNHCKNPLCTNFTVPYTGKASDPNYKRSAGQHASHLPW